MTNTGLIGVLLLEEQRWSEDEFLLSLEEKWGIVPDKEDDDKGEDGSRSSAFSYNDMNINLNYVPSHISNNEMEYFAQFNYLWKDAVQQTAKHTAHLIVTLSGSGTDSFTKAITMTKVLESCVKSDKENVLGVYTNGIVYEPEYYCENALDIDEDEIPINDLVWFGYTKTEDGSLRGYTMGLENFDKREIEVLNCKDTPAALIELMTDVAAYVITEDITLSDGETIGFTENQRLYITLSEGIEIDMPTLKIDYPND